MKPSGPSSAAAVDAGAGRSEQRALDACGRGEPDLDRLAVGAERAACPAGAQQPDPDACRRAASESPSDWAAATAAPIGPHTAVGCQPPSYRAGWLAAATAAIASKPSA